MAEDKVGEWYYRAAYKDELGGRTWGVVEYYPAPSGEGGWTGFIAPQGDDIDELKSSIVQMLYDLTVRSKGPLVVEPATPAAEKV